MDTNKSLMRIPHEPYWIAKGIDRYGSFSISPKARRTKEKALKDVTSIHPIVKNRMRKIVLCQWIVVDGVHVLNETLTVWEK